MTKFYITTPIYYVNSKPHIGHSYTEIACDALARYMRASGRETLFLTGTDEHGEKIERAATERGITPQAFVDEIVPHFKTAWERLGIRYDRFIRTTDADHIEAVRRFFEEFQRAGKLYKKKYTGWFCTPCETFWSESQAVGGICPDCKRPVEKLDEENYFLKASEYQEWLVDHINANPGFIRPDFRRNEVLGFLRTEKLQDLCVSRPKKRMAWGIELPFDRDYVAYVWVDALINYAAGAGFPRDMARFAKWWPCDVHVIGKDIIRHHAVIWPIMLKCAGLEPPRSIYAHGWWVMKGEKMSKSKGNVVDPLEMIDRYGVDAFRYFLLREVPFGLDGAFSEESFIARYNADLANDLGNLLNRTLTMGEKYFEGKIPAFSKQQTAISKQGTEKLKNKALGLAGELEKRMPELDFSGALAAIWEVVGVANKLIEEAKPWALAKEGKTDELAQLIYALLDSLRAIAAALKPFMPVSSIAILRQLGYTVLGDGISVAALSPLPAGQQLSKEGPLFPRIETP